MRLRNKKTGEIRKVHSGKITIFLEDEENPHDPDFIRYNSLKELNEEWEDYEEPKEYWYIAELCGGLQRKQDTDNGEDRFNKQIGNYFETKEEAESVVNLLKRIALIKSYGCNVYEYINNVVLSVEDYYERNKNEKRIL